MPYIAYSTPKANGTIYATVVESQRNGNKVTQKRIENLGRVLNRDKGIFQNRARGIYRYTIDDGAVAVNSDDLSTLHSGVVPTHDNREKLILDFGDSYLLYEYIKKKLFFEAIIRSSL